MLLFRSSALNLRALFDNPQLVLLVLIELLNEPPVFFVYQIVTDVYKDDYEEPDDDSDVGYTKTKSSKVNENSSGLKYDGPIEYKILFLIKCKMQVSPFDRFIYEFQSDFVHVFYLWREKRSVVYAWFGHGFGYIWRFIVLILQFQLPKRKIALIWTSVSTSVLSFNTLFLGESLLHSLFFWIL